MGSHDHAKAHTIASHSDTTATGAELEELTDGSETALHSHAGNGAALAVAETEVYNGTPAVETWADLDLSGTVGSNAALVLLKITCNVATRTVAFRKNGDVDEFYVDAAVSGCALLDVSLTSLHYVALVATDDTGKIEWIADDDRVFVIDIIAYIK